MTRTAAAKARRRATQNAKSAAERPNCPTPAKRAYDPDTTEAIGRAVHRSRMSGQPLRIYLCECGKQHLTSRVQQTKAA
ncbi:hypothetical protein [Arthrobacter bambusae]|uniref:hypothetical protein n=1 Tax=Arthrobacter bambusae TaxID=1338426 RepID=UPI00278341E8|nr:hypothetical protein [Arthrobacter bambusae]MDQ0241225.1 hypothetical protein [Arthrobacter bambusae]